MIDLTFLIPSQGFIIQGDKAGDRIYDVSSAGDVNGDGFADLIVGARNGDDGGTDAGEAYVVFGRASGFGKVDGTGRSVIDLTKLTPSNGFIIQGDAAGDAAGFSVSSAGDVNGDGFADLIVGAPLGDDGGYGAGEAYVVFGHASGFGTVDGTGRSVIDLSNVGSSFTASQGFVVQGGPGRDLTGFSVSSAGDINGDGFDDLIVGAPRGDDGGSIAGEAYVVFGHASGFGTVDGTGRSVIDLSNVSSSFTASQGFVVQGDAAGDFTGYRVSSAGDINGDGFADLIVGAPSGAYGANLGGAAYVLFGRAAGFGTVDGTGRSVIDLTFLTPSEGFIVQGDAAGDLAGASVSSAGDVNGDGFADLVVGAFSGDDGGDDAGEAYVVFGHAGGFGTVDGTGRSVIDLSNLGSSFTPVQGFVIQGDAAGDFAGYSTSAAGDVNGDGFSDLIVSAPYGDDGGSGAGEAYVVFGKASGFGTVDGTGRAVIDLAGLAAADGFVVQGDAADDNAGWRVSSAGDINNDGFADMIVGARYGDDGGDGAGEAYVLFGGEFIGSTIIGSDGNNTLLGGDGNDHLIGLNGDDTLEGGVGDDTLDGGADSDTAAYASATSGVKVSLSIAGAQNTQGAGIDTLTGVENLTGSSFADTLTGNGSSNVLIGGAGNDTLDGKAGADTMIGGTGNDIYVVDDAGDVVTEAAGEGTDTVKTTLSSYTLGADVDRLTFTGSGNFVGTGNGLANTLTGGAGSDTLVGGLGRDTLTGGADADIFQFFAGDSTVASFDKVTDFSTGVDKLDLSIFAGVPAASAYAEITVASDSLPALKSAAQAQMSATVQAVFVAAATNGWLFWNTDANPGTAEEAVMLTGKNSLGSFGVGDLT